MEAHLEDLAEDQRQVVEVVVRPPGVHSREQDEAVVDNVDEDLGKEPDFANDRANEAIFRLEILSDLARDDDALKRGPVVAPLSETDVELEDV